MSNSDILSPARRVIGSALRIAARIVVSTLVAVALVGSTVGCYAFRAPTAPLKLGQATRLEFPQGIPLASLAQTQQKDTTRLRTVTAIEGMLVGATTDSVRLVVKRTFPAEPRASKQIVVVPQSPAMRIQQRQFSGTRTTLLLVGIAALLLAFAAYAVSQIEYDWGDGSGAGY